MKKDVLQKRFRSSLKMMIISFLSLLLIILFIATVSTLLLSLPSETSDNILQLEKSGDYVVIGSWLIVAIFTYVVIHWSIKKKTIQRRPIITILVFFNAAILLSTLIPLLIINKENTTEGVQSVLINTNLFLVVTAILLLISMILTLLLLKERLYKNNWWAFLITVPYIVAAWVIQSGFTNMHELTEHNKVKDIVFHLQEAQENPYLLNDTWIYFLSMIIVTFILILGVMLFESFWKKTNSWRRITKKKTA